MMPAEIEIIKRTELDNVIIMTTRRPAVHLFRPFQTFIHTSTSRYAQRLTDFATEAAALLRHEQLLKMSNHRGTP